MCLSSLLLLAVFFSAYSENALSFLNLLVHFTLIDIRHNYIQKFSGYLSSFILEVHVSLPCRTTLKIKHLQCVSNSIEILLVVRNAYTFFKSSLTHRYHTPFSTVQLPFHHTVLTKHLNEFTCSTVFPSKNKLTKTSFFLSSPF